MREIKFRAWHVILREMIHQRTEQDLKDYPESGFRVSFEGLIFECDNNGTQIPLTGDVILMQYTGLKDKNGKEIYEGDIVAANIDGEDVEGVVERGDSFVGRGLKCERCQYGSYSLASTAQMGRKVVGNIYETKSK